ncbi:MAG TPA: oligopeptide/dipeptide ABC transporter ATP-binding protein [Polyangiaceae bacterium]|nr:oligopeptide/dipeptide ABC transporter ATP-binding protein [Polyangiaceae bacterium]
MTIEHVSKSFGVRKSLLSSVRVPALDDVSLPLRRGRVLALVGESGSGKSTLARLLMRLDEPSAGAIRIEQGTNEVDIASVPLREYYRRVQMVFQDPYASINPRKRIWQIVTAAASNLGTHAQGDMRRVAEENLDAVGIGHQHLDAFPNALSGGQRQRVCIARALAAKPELLVLDEPLSSLDVSIQAQILNLLLELQRRLGLTYLFISHDLAVVRHIADDVAVMYAGRLVEYGTVEAVIDAPSHPYTRALVASALGGADGKRGARARGELQAATLDQLGCNFLPRCDQADAQCQGQRPSMRAFPDRRVACFRAKPSGNHDGAETCA